MSRHTTDVQESVQEYVPSLPLPADHVLNSGAVLFPGAFDQHGCPLIVFPVEGQGKLFSELSTAEVVDFINYFLCLHNKRQEKESLVSVVADLRHASLPATRFIAETLLLLELHKRTVHSVYIIQPKKKDVVKLLLKLLAPARCHAASFKKVFLKEISELSTYIDRSQLTASLGGYLIYCHQSWVAFIKEIDAFVQEFLSVVQRLPSCISTLQALSRLPLPTTFRELQWFCSTNEAKFQQLRRELGLDELLRHCESVVEKLRHPEKELCYQEMAGTALFTHTTFDMLQNHSRITAAVEKVELLWQQAFSQARLQLQVFQLREDALQVTEQIEILLQEKLQPYKIEIAKDAAKAAMLVSHFEASIHTPAMALVRRAEDVIHTLAEILPFDGQSRERWALDLERLKEKLCSAVHFIFQTLRAVSNYHHYFNKANSWYSLVLCENFLQELLSGVNVDGVPTQQQRRNWGSVPAWRHKLSTFLKKNPPPHMEELVHLAHLSNVIPDDAVHQAGKQMSQRCMTLRKLLISSGPVAVGHLQQALQWQYELLWGRQLNQSSADSATNRTAKDVQDRPSESELSKCESGKEAASPLGTSPSTAVSGMVSAEGKPPSLSSFDSGF
ncbi:puratrophin-1 [Lates calcarifer]|uniref:Puratrophin-1 n=1 Tax=Lates calcarifer TaxID=8187 RepID=A0AAJ7VIA2_LATCA|nr:puratrophin-1 [Lates calcarifer]